MQTLEQVFAELDPAARANLSVRGVMEYERYKASLIADGDSAQEVEEVLRGFIWDQAEMESRETSQGVR